MGFEQLFYYSLAAGLCTALGAVLLLSKRDWNTKSLAMFLGLAAGVMLAVVFFDMLPSALVYGGWRPTLLGVVLGLLLLAWVDHRWLKTSSSDQNLISLGYLVMLGIAVHDFPEGMAIALGQEMKARTGMVIALGIGIHNIPEGMAIAAPLLMAGVRRYKIVVQTLMIGLITPLGALSGHLLLAGLPQYLPVLLGLASGIMLYLVFFQLWPQAKKQNNSSRWRGLLLGIIIIFIATFA